MAFPNQNTWIFIPFDLNSVLTRQTSEKVTWKPGLDYLLQCFLPSSFARNISKISETVERLQPLPPRPAPAPGLYAHVQEIMLSCKNLNHYFISVKKLFSFSNETLVLSTGSRRVKKDEEKTFY